MPPILFLLLALASNITAETKAAEVRAKDRTFIQATSTSPFASKTRQETMEESRRNPALSTLPAMIKLETNGGRWDSIETDWEDAEAMRSFRHQLRRSVDFFLLEAMERMRGTPIATPTVDTFTRLSATFLFTTPKVVRWNPSVPRWSMPLLTASSMNTSVFRARRNS
jgi:hypothetical protein